LPCKLRRGGMRRTSSCSFRAEFLFRSPTSGYRTSDNCDGLQTRSERRGNVGEGGAGTAVSTSFSTSSLPEPAKSTQKRGRKKNGSKAPSCNLERRKNQCVLRFHLTPKREATRVGRLSHHPATGVGLAGMGITSFRVTKGNVQRLQSGWTMTLFSEPFSATRSR
jgi:hypothetical protein